MLCTFKLSFVVDILAYFWLGDCLGCILTNWGISNLLVTLILSSAISSLPMLFQWPLNNLLVQILNFEVYYNFKKLDIRCQCQFPELSSSLFIFVFKKNMEAFLCEKHCYCYSFCWLFPWRKLKLAGKNLGQAFSFRNGRVFASWTSFSSAKLPSLKWKTRPKPILGSFPLAFGLPIVSHISHNFRFIIDIHSYETFSILFKVSSTKRACASLHFKLSYLVTLPKFFSLAFKLLL